MKNNLENIIEEVIEIVFRPKSFLCGNCGLNLPGYCKCFTPKIDPESRAKSILLAKLTEYGASERVEGAKEERATISTKETAMMTNYRKYCKIKSWH